MNYYPANYFDPYRDEITHVACCECGDTFDISDAEPVDDPDGDWVCDWCAGK